MLQSINIQFEYDRNTAFRFPDIQCSAGEACVITGISGKGKTTLLHLLGGLLKPSFGSIVIEQTDITRLNGKQLDTFRGRHIGIVFQQSHFVASLTVLENLLLVSWLSGKKQHRQKANKLLDQLDVATQAYKKPAALSQGQQQRVSIARALMNDPLLLLADEPTSSLDDENCIKVATLLQQRAMAARAALVIVTHDQRLKDQFKKIIHLT